MKSSDITFDLARFRLSGTVYGVLINDPAALAAVVDDLRYASCPIADGEPAKVWTLRVLGEGRKLREGLVRRARSGKLHRRKTWARGPVRRRCTPF